MDYATPKSACEPIRPESEMERQINQARSAIDRLMTRTDALRAALDPVLKPANVTSAAGCAPTAPRPVLAPLSDSVCGLGDRVDEVVQQLESLLNRLAI